MAGKIHIKWIKSGIGCKADHRRTIQALGLRKLNDVVEKKATPQIMGMVRKVSYLLEVKESVR